VLVATLYDRLLGMSLGLVGKTRPESQVEPATHDALRHWVEVALALWKTLPAPSREPESPSDVICALLREACNERPLDVIERSIALAIGVFCWCDRDDILTIWCETLYHDLDPDRRYGAQLFSIVLRSFLQEPPGRTVWLPLKRKTTIDALRAFSPEAPADLQQPRLALHNHGDIFRASTAIACQLPWHRSACKLANCQGRGPAAHRIIGALHGAAFGTIAFRENQRATCTNVNCDAIALEVAPLWRAWTGSPNAIDTAAPFALTDALTD